jgi:Isochorismatase family
MYVDAIDPKKTAMIVVDMQNDFVASGAAMETPAARHIVPQLAKALRICRETGIKIIYTAHVHRSDGCDMGLFDDMHPPIANRHALVDGTLGVEIYPELAPAVGGACYQEASLQRLFWHGPRHYPAGVGSRYRHHLGDHYRELLPGHGARRDVSQLSSRLSVGRNSYL